MSKQHYLGDGLYLEDCGFQFRLYTPQGNEVFLDDSTLTNFFQCLERLRNVKIKITKEELPNAGSDLLQDND